MVEEDTDRYGRLVGNSLSCCQCSFQNSYLMYLGGNHHNHNDGYPPPGGVYLGAVKTIVRCVSQEEGTRALWHLN